MQRLPQLVPPPQKPNAACNDSPLRKGRAICVRAIMNSIQEKAAPLVGRSGRNKTRQASLDRESDDVVAALGVDLGVASRTDDNVLLAVNLVRRRGRIHARAGL